MIRPDPEKCKTCQYCYGKPDFVYFNDHDGQILAVICQSCRDIWGAVISGMGRRED